jgi:hypothetical protein
MVKKKFTHADVQKITGAKRHKSITAPFYYAPPFLDELKEFIGERLSSSGGRPKIEGAEVVRKVRFTKKNWQRLESIAKTWSKSGPSVSPAQVATSIIQKALEGEDARE